MGSVDLAQMERDGFEMAECAAMNMRRRSRTSDPEDVLSDALLGVACAWNSWHKLDPAKRISWRGYAYTAAVNGIRRGLLDRDLRTEGEYYAHVKMEDLPQHRQSPARLDAPLPSGTITLGEMIASRVGHDHSDAVCEAIDLWGAVDALDEKSRKVVVAWYYGLDCAEIGQDLGYSNNTGAWKRMRSAFDLLRPLLKVEG